MIFRNRKWHIAAYLLRNDITRQKYFYMYFKLCTCNILNPDNCESVLINNHEVTFTVVILQSSLLVVTAFCDPRYSVRNLSLCWTFLSVTQKMSCAFWGCRNSSKMWKGKHKEDIIISWFSFPFCYVKPTNIFQIGDRRKMYDDMYRHVL